MIRKSGEFHPLLFGGIPVADGDGFVGQTIKVDGDTERRSYFVLSVVAFADITAIVPNNLVTVLMQHLKSLFGFSNQLGFVFEQRKDGDLEWYQFIGEF